MQKRKNSLLILLIVILCFVLVLNIFYLTKTRDIVGVRKIDASVIVANKIGFDLNSTALTFGEVTRGGSALRKISIENNYDFPIEVLIYGVDGMERFVVPVRENISISEKKEIDIIAKIPDDAQFGKYEGKIIVRITRKNE